MYELAQNLILNENELNTLSEKKRPIFIYEWLSFLNKVLIAADKDDIEEYQSRILEQLLRQIQNKPDPPVRILISRNLVSLVSLCNPVSVLDVVNYCHGILKSKDEIAKLTSIVVIGAVYERSGSLLNQSYDRTVQLLLETLKVNDPQMRGEILHTLERIINGLGPTGHKIYPTIFYTIKPYVCDQIMSIRLATVSCLKALIDQNNFMSTSEFEANLMLGFRAFNGSDDKVCYSVANYIATLLATSQNTSFHTNLSADGEGDISAPSIKRVSIENIFNYLTEMFWYDNIHLSIYNPSKSSEKSIITSHEIRIGVTQIFVEFVRIMGKRWIEQNLSFFINHILALVGHFPVSTSHVNIVHSRKCIAFILRSVNSLYLNEKAQFTAAKELITIIGRHTVLQPTVTSDSNLFSLSSSTNSMVQSYESTQTNRYEPSDIDIFLCALDELSLLIQSFGTSTSILLEDNDNNLVDILFIVILHPSYAVRLSAAWCFRSLGTALPSLMEILIDKCFRNISELAKQSSLYNTDAMFAIALALQALIGGVHQCPLGIPIQYEKMIFDFAEDLLRTAIVSTIDQPQSLIPRLILQRITTAWHLLSACCIINQKQFIPRLVHLWRCVFPRSQSAFEYEKQRGDSCTWILSLNQRAGALCSMISFLISHEDLLTNDFFQHLLIPIENAILVLLYTPDLQKQFGCQLKASIIIFRLRLYELLLRIPIDLYERYINALVKEVIAEFTLMDNSSNMTTSLLKTTCYNINDDLFGNSLHPLTEKYCESNSTNDFSFIEHDQTYLYRQNSTALSSNIIQRFYQPSSLLPCDIAVIDASIRLYSIIFVRVSNKQHLDIFQYFLDTIKRTNSARQEAIQTNIITAISISLKTFIETKQAISFNNDHLKKYICTFAIQLLSHSNPLLHRAASDALGHLTQVMNDGRFITDMTKLCLNHLKKSHTTQARIGYLLTLGSLYRYTNNTSTKQDLNLSIATLLAFAHDQSTPLVQVSALHVLTVIADNNRQLFRSYVELSFALILHLLFSTSLSCVDIYRCCGRLLCALIVIIGSDFDTDTNSKSLLRSSCLTAVHLLQIHVEPSIQAEAIEAAQKLYLFIPREINLSTLVPELIKGLGCRDLNLRRRCILCLRQLLQGKPEEVHKYAMLFMQTSNLFAFRSIEELLFSMLDTETDIDLCSNIQEILICMLQTSGSDNLTHWFRFFNNILHDTKGFNSAIDK